MAEVSMNEPRTEEVHEAGKHAPGTDPGQGDEPSAAPESGQPSGGRDRTQREPAESSGEDF